MRRKWIVTQLVRLDLRREPVRAQRRLTAVIHQVEHALFIRKAHLGFRRVHVDVDGLRRNRQIERARRKTPDHKHVAVSFLKRGHACFGAHKTRVDKKVLERARAARERRPADQSLKRQALQLIRHRDRLFREFASKHAARRGGQLAAARRLKAHRAVADELKRNLGICQRLLFDDGRHAVSFRKVLFEKFHTRGRIIEYIAHTDCRADGTARVGKLSRFAARDCVPRPGDLVSRACEHLNPAHRRDRRERLAAKAHRGDMPQILLHAHLTRRMAQKRVFNIFTRNAAAVIRHTDIAHAAALDFHCDLCRAGVDGIFD